MTIDHFCYEEVINSINKFKYCIPQNGKAQYNTPQIVVIHLFVSISAKYNLYLYIMFIVR